MQQIARNVTMEGCGALRRCRYFLHDRDKKYTQAGRQSRCEVSGFSYDTPGGGGKRLPAIHWAFIEHDEVSLPKTPSAGVTAAAE
jgi:hypothetical protein